MDLSRSLRSFSGTSSSQDTWFIFNTLLFLAGLFTWLRSTWTVLYRYAENTCLATVHIKDSDPLYHDVLQWMNDHVFAQNNFRSVLAISTNRSTSKAAGEKFRMKDLTAKWTRNPNDSEKIQFRPFQGSRIFSFQGRWIFFTHAPPVSAGSLAGGSGFFGDRGGGVSAGGLENTATLKLQTLSLSFSLSPSLQHIRGFLTAASAYNELLKKQNATISIHRAIADARNMVRWNRVTTRPTRPIDTVILETTKKNAVLSDLHEYLQPATRQWYADHGIPYRRGYLFSGPPGTGKTSLSSAIAGAFGLDVYVLSLLDADISEAHFLRLFSEVPEKCVVLLEDIDAAGMSLKRPAQEQPRPPRPYPAMADSSSGGVSLSGLLNAIDGVSSQEGRVLIMTTNAPQSLDPALIRPGRVDMHVRFDLPGRVEFKELFCSMFNDVPTNPISPVDGKDEEAGDQKEKEKTDSNTERDLETLAEYFAEKLPEQKLSLAEVQGFLMQHKRKPEEACARVEEWLESMQELVTSE
ncbi:P-loop containing nucleoside triphosphate hydrolase protein [Aspergillus unguis]